MDTRKDENNGYSWTRLYDKYFDPESISIPDLRSFYFYGELLFNLLKETALSKNVHLAIDDQFIILFTECVNQLQKNYALDYEKATKEAASSDTFNAFITTLHKNGFLTAREIRKAAPYIAQDIRTSDPNNPGFFAKINQNLPDFFSEVGKYLGEDPTAITEQLFSYNKKDIQFSQDGTDVPLIKTVMFNAWFEGTPTKESIPLKDGFTIYKLNENTIAINKGPGTVGIQIKKQGDGFIACNNYAADKKNSARESNLTTTLSALQDVLFKKNIDNLPKPEAGRQVKDEIKKSEKMHPFSFEKNPIAYNKNDETQVKLSITDAFNTWFDQTPVGKPLALKDGYVIYKLNENTIAINKGLNTPGIQIKKKEDSFIASNNLSADSNPDKLQRNNNLETVLSALHDVLSGKNIDDLSVQINNQITKYKTQISNERKSSFWVSDKSIKLWQDKIAVLTFADNFLLGKTTARLLQENEAMHPGWSDGVETKALVDKVKLLKEIPLNWKDYSPRLKLR